MLDMLSYDGDVDGLQVSLYSLVPHTLFSILVVGAFLRAGVFWLFPMFLHGKIIF